MAGLLSAKALWAQQKLDVKHRLEALTDFYNYLSIPNTSDNQRGIQQTLDFVSSYLEGVGVETEIWEENQTRYLYGYRDVGAPKTILIYLQLDALEVDAAAWNQLDPFKPVLKMRKSGQWQPLEDVSTAVTLDSTYVFARGASDSKGPSFALLYALKQLSEFSIQPKVNLKIIGDTAEEKGSKDLNALVQSKAAELKADALLILDGTRSLADVLTLTFGARGIAQLSLTTYGARSELHSGQYGGIAANPWYEMTALINTLVDENQRVLVTDFDPYKETKEEERYFRELTLGGYEELENRIGAPTLSRYQHPQQDYQHPTFILKGMYSGNGDQKIQTKIPSEVTAAFELRLTPETPAERQ
ncbi:MAG: M20/M25/M40 family metallo-hydrolase, partial [Bacteroidetes bacterium]|nr:M20/M25/M40 family metallo-hydrolase [Bacteroidota bacterium]